MPKLMIVNGSVREGRIAQPIAEWVRRVAEADGRFEVDDADLKQIALPLMDEPHHPRLRKYTKPYTLAWSERVEAAEAFVFVFPEYNHSFSPAIKNALDYLVHEWARKPVGFVNWGGNSGGTRAAAALVPVITALGMVRTRGNVEINMPGTRLDDDGAFVPSEQQQGVLGAQLDELVTLDAVLRELR
ncbi:MAG: NAD(P)H-dependent oxidoreductase [Microbacterium sp.]